MSDGPVTLSPCGALRETPAFGNAAGLTSVAQLWNSLVTTRVGIPGLSFGLCRPRPLSAGGFRGVVPRSCRPSPRWPGFRLTQRAGKEEYGTQQRRWYAPPFLALAADLEIGPRCSDSGADERVVALLVIRSSAGPFCCRSRARSSLAGHLLWFGRDVEQWISGVAFRREKLRRRADGRPRARAPGKAAYRPVPPTSCAFFEPSSEAAEKNVCQLYSHEKKLTNHERDSFMFVLLR